MIYFKKIIQEFSQNNFFKKDDKFLEALRI